MGQPTSRAREQATHGFITFPRFVQRRMELNLIVKEIDTIDQVYRCMVGRHI